MSTNRSKSLFDIINNSDSSVSHLADEARERMAIGDRIRAALPSELGRQVVHCAFDDDDVLVVRASAPEWAARLRFESEALLIAAREEYPRARSVKVRVARP